jgi:predicted metalloprotease
VCLGDEDDPSDDVIAFDATLAADQYNEIGDFAVSGLISREYSRLAQQRIGEDPEDADQRDFSLQADCFSGAWAGELTLDTLQGDGQAVDDPDIGSVLISAGDLDEAVQSFLLLAENQPDGTGTTFERVSSFRDGFFNGLDDCADYLTDGAPSADEGIPTTDGG